MKAVFKTTGGKEPLQGSVAYSAGETIFSQGDLGTEMFIILEGEVHIIKHINQESHLLSKLEKGDFFASNQIPVVRDLPFGHHGDNLVMPIGAPVRLSTREGTLTIAQAAVRT